MPDNSSGFIDFNQYSDLNRDEETRMLEEAMARAEAADGRAKGALSKANRDAQGGYGADGQFTGNAETLAKSASYSDYLSAKGDAEAAWAAVTGSSRNPYSDSLRDNIRGSMGVSAKSGVGSAGLKASEAQYGQGIANTWTGINKQRGEQAAAAAEKNKMDEDNAAAQIEGAATQKKAFQDRVAEVWARRDGRAQSSFGSLAYEGSSKWTPAEIYKMDELKREAIQKGMYAEFGADGAWETDAQYMPGGGSKTGNVGFTVGHLGTGRATYSNDARMNYISRQGGFRGFKK